MRKLRIGCVNEQDLRKIVLPMRNICARLYFFPRCAIYAQDLCARLYLFLQCAIYAQDCTYFPNAQYTRKSCARVAQDCTYFLNAQYMRKICARLSFFLQCEIYAKDLHKIVLISSMQNICARFVQDCTYFAQDCTSFSNAQYMRNICARLYLFLQWAIYAHDLRKIVLLSPVCNICTRLQALLGEICHTSHICSKFWMVFTSMLFLDCHKLWLLSEQALIMPQCNF